MKLFTFSNETEYEAAMLRRYKNNPHFINNKSGIFKTVCNPKSAFYKNTIQKMIGIKLGKDILCQCVLIKHNRFDALMIAFFESAENVHSAVNMMMSCAEDFGKNAGAKRIIVSMDGHCNYSIGFSKGEISAPPLFGESRNPSYYGSYFQEEYKEIQFSGYYGDFDTISRDALAASERIKKRISDIHIRCVDFNHFQAETERYTNLSNRIFDNHWYYYLRDSAEDFELFKTMKPLLSPCNLIFAVKDGIEIGYMLLYPDFNELVPIGGKADTITFIRHKILKRPIHTVKIAEIAVLPEYQSSGVIIALFDAACKKTKKQYPHIKRVVSSWIMEGNSKSLNITKRFAPNFYASYTAYEKEI